MKSKECQGFCEEEGRRESRVGVEVEGVSGRKLLMEKGAPVINRHSQPQKRRYFKGFPKSAADSSSKPPWRSPDHPPYSQMVEITLRALAEKGGSTESSISAYMQSIFTGLPWGHDRLLPYYLGKFVDSGELSSPSHGRYQLPSRRPPLISDPSRGRRRGRPPLHGSDPPSSTTPDLLHSIPLRHRSLFRGRNPKNLGKRAPPLHLEHGSAPSRRRRGRPRLHPEGTIDGTVNRRSVLRIPSSRGSGIRQDGFRIRDLPRISAFFDDKNNVGDESAGPDNPERFELIHAQSSPGKVQAFPSTEQFSPVKEPPFLPPDLPEFREHGEGVPFCSVNMCDYSPLISAFSNDKENEDSETCSLNDPESPEHVNGSLNDPESPEHVNGSLNDPESPEHVNGGEGQFIAAAKLSEYGDGQFSPVSELPLPSLEPMEISSFLAPEIFEHDMEKSPQGEAPPSPVLEQAELGQEQTLSGEGRPLLSSEKPEIGDNCPEKFQDCNEKWSPGKRTALVALEQESLVQLPPPDGFEVESLVGSSKQKKLRKRNRRLRLWFEG